MALKPTFLLSLHFTATLWLLSNSQILSTIPYQLPSECKDGSSSSDGNAEFFNSATLECTPCSENSTVQQQSPDGLTCICRPGYRYVKNFGGSQVACQRCPNAVSADGWECVTCGTGSVEDANTRQCSRCTDQATISALRRIDGTLFGLTKEVTCQTCGGDTQPNSDQSQCNRCSYTLSIRELRSSATTTCACTTPGEIEINDICFPDDNPVGTLDFLIPLENDNEIRSVYLETNLRIAYYMCREPYRNITACQALANMCVLTMYRGGLAVSSASQKPCNLFARLNAEVSGNLLYNVRPSIFVGELNADDELAKDDIETEWTMDPPMQFPFLASTYSIDGSFLGFQSIDGGSLQLCEASDTILNAAFVFGTYYTHSCQIPASSLWNEVKYPLKFYEIYLQYTATTGTPGERIYKIPVLIRNYIDQSNTLPNQDTIKDWQLVRRFFLVDNVATKTVAGQDAPHVRYAKSITLRVSLLPDTSNGRISVPYFDIVYDDISRERADAGENVQVTFQVTYEMSQSAFKENFQIAIGTISSLGVIYAGFRTYVWSRRAGRITIDFPTLANLIFFLCGTLSNCFFVVTYGIAFYFFIFYKRQNVVYLVHLDGKDYENWYIIFVSAFALKLVALLHMIVMQCSADIFLVDWERPKGQPPLPQPMAVGSGGDAASLKKQKSSVSIWRTYFVANEWNEIQTKRKINCVLQIFLVLFFLVVVGFEDTTTKDPDGTVNKASDVYLAEQSPMFRMALASTVYLVVAVAQVIFFVFIYERFITDDIREFVDLCSMSNISVFVMANGEFGYYIHGRSVHGRSDVGMREMCDMIKREEEDLVGQRGLVPNTEPQTFLMALPKRLRQKYETVYMPVQLENASAATRGDQARMIGRDKSIDAYGTLNRFFCAFIDHSLRDIDYVVKEKTFLEKVLDTEFLELTDKGIFYNDNGHSFDNVLFYGNEMMLIVFDTLFFCVVDYVVTDFILAGFLTYLVTELMVLIRDIGGKKNLAKKTLVDERFLI